MYATISLAPPHPSLDPISLSYSLPDPSTMEAPRNPWGSFFDPPQSPDDLYDFSAPGPSRPDLDQQLSQRLFRDESSSLPPPAHPFPHIQDVHISPAAMFLGAFSTPTQPTRMPDDEGETVAGYVLGPVIGRGGFSIIRTASSPSGGVVAIKIVRRSDVERQSDPSLTRKRLAHETEIWSSLSHEHILPLFSVQHSQYADFYVNLFCPAGSLFDILKRDGTPALPHDDAGMMFRQVVRGIRYLHETAGYVHRDIKLENVLVDEMGVCRICDFGLTRKIGESDHEECFDAQDTTLHRHRSAIHHTLRQPKAPLSTHASILRHKPRHHRTSTPTGDQSLAPVHPAHAFQPGSLPYAAPELLSPQAPGKHHGANPAQDMWALGCLLYALLTGRLPFSDPFEPRLTMKILHGVFDMPSNVGRGTTRLLKGCLERDVRIRWTIAMVDEMAWDIGWGQVDDSVSHGVEFEFVDFPSQPSTSSRRLLRSLSCDRNSIPDGPSSRIRRSLSRTSVSSSSSLSTRSTSRSASRPPTAIRLPLATACDDVGHAVLNARTPESSPMPLEIGGSTLMSPMSPIERGRSRIKADSRLTNRFAPSIGGSTALSDLGHEASRGRDMYPGADRLDNTARWASALGLNTIAEVTTHLNGASSPAMEKLRRVQNLDSLLSAKCKVGKRAESTPPTASTWRLGRSRAVRKEHSPSLRLGEPAGINGAFLRQPSATPIPIVRKNCKRSQSMGPEPDNTARRLF